MSTNPHINALFATGYILLVVSGIRLVGVYAGDKPDNEFLAPVIMLSLLVLSASIMAFIFFYRPLLLLLDGKRIEALGFFMRTVGTFAAVTIGIVGLMFALLQ